MLGGWNTHTPNVITSLSWFLSLSCCSRAVASRPIDRACSPSLSLWAVCDAAQNSPGCSLCFNSRTAAFPREPMPAVPGPDKTKKQSHSPAKHPCYLYLCVPSSPWLLCLSSKLPFSHVSIIRLLEAPPQSHVQLNSLGLAFNTPWTGTTESRTNFVSFSSLLFFFLKQTLFNFWKKDRSHPSEPRSNSRCWFNYFKWINTAQEFLVQTESSFPHKHRFKHMLLIFFSCYWWTFKTSTFPSNSLWKCDNEGNKA